jgi:hypothetical protein
MISVLKAPAATLSATDVGRCGENLIAYQLERAGVSCSVVDRRGTDIWCRSPGGVLFALEVKTATAPSNRGRGQLSYSFQVRSREIEWYAFVALDIEQVIYRHVSELKPYITHRDSPQLFSEYQTFCCLTRMLSRLDVPNQIAA